MTSPVGSQHSAGAVHHTSKAQAPSESTFPGKSGESVGHLAKASVLESGDSAPNAQGKAASRIARMDLTVLAPPPAGDGTDVTENAGLEAPSEPGNEPTETL